MTARDGLAHSSEFVGFGYSYPSQIVDNDAFLARCQFPIASDIDGLIRDTQMKTRFWCAPSENTWTMAREAAQLALSSDPALRELIDVVVVASGSTMPVINPPDRANAGMADLSALVLRDVLGRDALAIDVKAVYCSGFLRALQVADGLLQNPSYRAALVIAAEQGGRLSTAPSNRSTFCFILGDAAGAVVLQRVPGRTGVGLIDYLGHMDASMYDLAGIGPDGNSTVMKGSRAAEATHRLLVDCARQLLARNTLTPSDVDWLIPIQTHAGVIEAVRAELGWPRDRLIWAGDRTGFSGSASIPACLAEQIHNGAVSPGDLILSVAVGAGLNCAGALYRL